MKHPLSVLLLAGGLIYAHASYAQSKPVTMAIKPVAMNMAEYNKTPLGIARLKQYASSFGGSTDGTESKTFKYGDGSNLNLKLVKHPAFGGQATDIKANVKKDPKETHPANSAGGNWNCSTDHVQLTATSTSFLNNDYSSSASHIYPGAIYTFEGFYNGSYKEQDGDRNPLTLITDNVNVKGKPYVLIDNPNQATIRTGIDELFKEAKPPATTESLTYQIYESSSLADESMKISGGASGYGVSLSAGYHTASQSKTRTLTIDAIKTLFSINTIPPDKGFFKNANVEAKPSLMVIGSVSYGVRVLANVTYTFDSEEEAANFSASYSGWGVSAHVDFDAIEKNKNVNSTINCYVVGGPGNSTISFNKQGLEKQIKDVIAKATYRNAMPVKYEFYDMAGNVIGSKSATDEFAVRSCTPSGAAGDPKLLSALVSITTGGDNKEGSTTYSLYLTHDKVTTRDGRVTLYAPYYLFRNNPSHEYDEKTSITDKLLQVKEPLTLKDFQKDGGILVLQIDPHGSSDEWDISKMSLTLNFEGDVIKPAPINFTSIKVDNAAHCAILYFDKNFSAKQ